MNNRKPRNPYVRRHSKPAFSHYRAIAHLAHLMRKQVNDARALTNKGAIELPFEPFLQAAKAEYEKKNRQKLLRTTMLNMRRACVFMVGINDYTTHAPAPTQNGAVIHEAIAEIPPPRKPRAVESALRVVEVKS